MPLPPYIVNPTIPAGVKYVKIARKDAQGNDNTLSLQELTDLRFAFSDVSDILNYEILNISEYPSYYLYSIKSLNVTSSADNNVLNYRISASKTTSIALTAGELYGVYDYTNVTDTPGYFDLYYGSILWGSTPNVTLQITASVDAGFIGLPQSSKLILYKFPGIVITSASGLPSTTITLKTTVTPIENDTYYLGIQCNSVANQTFSNVQLLVTQSTSPNVSSNLTILEPYLTENFFYNDCNVLYGNAVDLEYDVNFMKVNYDGNGGTVIPSNQQEILSNTAELAPVKPYNYRLLSQISPRYLGTKNSTDAVNVKTTTQVNSASIEANKDLGSTTLNLPAVTSEETFFAYFDYIGGTSYELIYKKGAHILYLIDKDGNTQTPNLNDPYYSNLVQNFSNQNVNIQFITSTGNVNNVEGIHPVIRAGYVPLGIIASQTGSSLNITSSMSFALTSVVRAGEGRGTGSAGYIATSSYFTQYTPNILYASQFISPIYTTPPTTQLPISASSGYADFLPFEIKYGDQIRFEGNEDKTYTIIDSIQYLGLYILLDRDIEVGTNINSFFIRRYIPNPNFIIIDVPAEGGGSGFLFPEYVTLDIQNNFDTIIQNLKTKGILPSI